MMRVKLFKANTLSELENSINEFLNDFYYDINISLSVDNNIFYAIVYYENADMVYEN